MQVAVLLKQTGKTLCSNCKDWAVAKWGVFEPLCEKCLEVKKKIKEKEFYPKEKKRRNAKRTRR